MTRLRDIPPDARGIAWAAWVAERMAAIRKSGAIDAHYAKQDAAAQKQQEKRRVKR